MFRLLIIDKNMKYPYALPKAKPNTSSYMYYITKKICSIKNTLFKWFICLHEQLGKHVISGGRLGQYVGGTILSLLLLLGKT